MTTKHTPGPWIIRETARGTWIIALAEYAGRHDFNMPLLQLTGNVKPDDARLIAAAPDLLAACEAVMKRVEETPAKGWTFRDEKTCNQINQAIRKARQS